MIDILVRGLERGKKNVDLLFAFLFILIILMMVVPLPPLLIDFLLVCNISFAVMTLLTTTYIGNPLQFSVFPSLLLFTTLFRLALNVSTTRLILLDGYAGRIIAAFGHFVVSGNYVVGFIIFLILIIIQFVVITNGAGRISEVAARFTLDAMPGKQMSIDADLNAGMIDEKEARKRRRDIERQADFYGAMDGASKFVKGDAIAGLIITLINFLGGFIVGSVQRGLPLVESLQTYALLTVGDGLVAQIPALLISTASGLIVTRTASDENLGKEMFQEFSRLPRVAILTAIFLVVLGLVPGLPKIPFFLLAFAVGGYGYFRIKTDRAKVVKQEEQQVAEKEVLPRSPEEIARLIEVDPVELEIGYGLIPLIDRSSGGDLLDRITQMRINMAREKGFIVPPIRVRDNLRLRPNEYLLKIRGMTITRGEVLPNHYLAMNPQGDSLPIEGVPTREPAFNLPAYWVNEIQKDDAELAGYTLVDSGSVLITHLSELVKNHSHELLSRKDMQTLVDQVKKVNPSVVEELIPNLMSVGEVQKVIQFLLMEQVSIRDLSLIMETLADYAPHIKNVEELTEMVRRKLGRALCSPYLGENNIMHVLTLDAKLEGFLAKVIEGGEILEPATFRRILESISRNIERMVSLGHFPILVTTGKMRRGLRNILSGYIPQLVTLSYEEIPRDFEIKVEGLVVPGSAEGGSE